MSDQQKQASNNLAKRSTLVLIKHRTEIVAWFSLAASAVVGYRQWNINETTLKLQQESIKSEYEEAEPKVVFENSNYLFTRNAARELEPYEKTQSMPAVVNICKQELFELRIEWEPLTSPELDWLEKAQLGPKPTTPFQNSTLLPGGRGELNELPEWLEDPSQSPANWKRHSKSGEPILSQFRVLGVGKDGRKMEWHFDYELTEFKLDGTTIIRLSISSPRLGWSQYY